MTNSIRFSRSIYSIGQQQWNSLSNTDNPFLRFEFLAALEDCNCIDSEKQTPILKTTPLNSGWIPSYALLENEEQVVLAIAPVFEKFHSYGEYVFDWAWADAYQHNGLKYYPKLVWAIPFTPSTGPRIISQGDNPQQLKYHQQIAEGLTVYCQQHNYSGWHCLFPNSQAQEAIKQSRNSMSRTSCQFHWFNSDQLNNSFTDFSHYLEKFTSRKRKNIKKERSRLLESGFSFHRKSGTEINHKDIENFYHCYQLTYAKRNSRGYLTLAFFKQLLKTMPEQLLLVQAQYHNNNESSNGESSVVANALYFKDSDNLYGRYWGCLEEFDSLHFECCYYQGIEYCIENNLNHFDPGTQGEHKISRGFEPTICHSQHWIAHPEFSRAINDFLTEEKLDIQHYAAQATEHLPFKVHQSFEEQLPSKIQDRETND
jgi:predicted N-acyltransferase